VTGDNASAYVAEALRDRMAREDAARRIRAAYGEIDQTAYSPVYPSKPCPPRSGTKRWTQAVRRLSGG
jgi:hypothetical protein